MRAILAYAVITCCAYGQYADDCIIVDESDRERMLEPQTNIPLSVSSKTSVDCGAAKLAKPYSVSASVSPAASASNNVYTAATEAAESASKCDFIVAPINSASVASYDSSVDHSVPYASLATACCDRVRSIFDVELANVDKAEVPALFSVALSVASKVDVPAIFYAAIAKSNREDIPSMFEAAVAKACRESVLDISIAAFANADPFDVGKMFEVSLSMAPVESVPMIFEAAIANADVATVNAIIGIALANPNRIQVRYVAAASYAEMMRRLCENISPAEKLRISNEWYDRFPALVGSKMWWISKIARERASKGEDVSYLKERFLAAMNEWLIKGD